MAMELALLGIIFILIFLIFYLLLTNKKEDTSFFREELKEMKEEIKASREKSFEFLQHQSGESRKINKESTETIKEITEKLAKLNETNKQVIGFAQQLQSLENILTNPKQRGILGEYYLEELLENVFSPSQYKMQYQFKDNQIVDAVIFAKNEKIIPIDSKFSLENYNRIIEERDKEKREKLERLFKQDLKTRIDETAKYIRPEEGTLNFAFMFIPAEAIYYDLLVNKIGAIKSNTRDLIEYAGSKHVIIVSPTSFHAYLQTVLQGLRAFQIEKSAMEIKDRVEKLGRHINSYDLYMQKLGKHLGTTCSSYNHAYKEFAKIDKDVAKITKKDKQINNPLQLEKPDQIK